MAGSIVIVDYSMGNLRSVQKAIEEVGGQVSLESGPKEVAAADKLILPGVGAFGDAMNELRLRELVEPIRAFAQSGRPMLGICLGMQLLFDWGEEFGQHEGLGILPGRSVRFQLPVGMKVPHMGWNEVKLRQKSNPLGQGLKEGDHFYFVHSYHVQPVNPEVVWMEADYGGPFCAAIGQDQIFATQFHPEKSQGVGLQLLTNFVQL